MLGGHTGALVTFFVHRKLVPKRGVLFPLVAVWWSTPDLNVHVPLWVFVSFRTIIVQTNQCHQDGQQTKQASQLQLTMTECRINKFRFISQTKPNGVAHLLKSSMLKSLVSLQGGNNFNRNGDTQSPKWKTSQVESPFNLQTMQQCTQATDWLSFSIDRLSSRSIMMAQHQSRLPNRHGASENPYPHDCFFASSLAFFPSLSLSLPFGLELGGWRWGFAESCWMIASCLFALFLYYYSYFLCSLFTLQLVYCSTSNTVRVKQ